MLGLLQDLNNNKQDDPNGKCGKQILERGYQGNIDQYDSHQRELARYELVSPMNKINQALFLRL